MRPRLGPLLQGSFYLLTGLWPVLHLRSFERVTGPKVDGWLVQTVGALLAVNGAVLLAGALARPAPPLRILAVGSAVALGTVDLVYATRGRISPIYFADAAVEAAFAAAALLEVGP